MISKCISTLELALLRLYFSNEDAATRIDRDSSILVMTANLLLNRCHQSQRWYI
ncbi:MAG: hypothetical protein R2788_26955 [Saprospiraceae bacterium]